MGKPGWEDETWTPGRSSRGSRADYGERSPGRAYDRDARSAPGRDDPSPRGSDRDRDYRPRPSNRGDDGRGSSGRQGTGGTWRGSSDPGSSSRSYDDRSGRGRSSYGRDNSDSRGGRDYRDPRAGGGTGGGSGSSRDPRRPGGYDERSMRGPQAPPRNRPPAGGGDGGLWGDGFSTRSSAHRPRAGYGVATDTTAGMGGRQGLDALRANRLRQQGIAEPEESVGGFTAGKAFVVVLLMLVLGAGGAYVYFKITTPPVHSNIGTGSSSTPSGFMPHHTSADFALTDWRLVSR